MKDKPINLV